MPGFPSPTNLGSSQSLSFLITNRATSSDFSNSIWLSMAPLATMGISVETAGCWTMERSSESHGAAKSGARRFSLKGLERNYGAGVGDSWDDLDLVADEVADIDIRLHVEFGQNVKVAGD